MASGAAELAAATAAEGLDRLERAARGAAAAVAAWKARAEEAEAQVRTLREELEAVTGEEVEPGAAAGGTGEELRRLRAEHALLTSRAAEARQRVAALLARLSVLEGRR
jgi:chromosome segregation ATPase